MKNLLVVLLAIALQPALAHAERFIVKNPKSPVVGQVVQTVRLGSDTYVVVEAPRFTNLLASFGHGAESVTEDLKIGIPKSENQPGTATKAWHPLAMHYADLPAVRDGRDIIVAVLDTGADYNHPNLKDHIYSNPKECDPAADKTKDNDGNGFAGDCHGYDFDKKIGDPMDGDQHGTHCAGIIGASPDEATGAQGVAPGVKIMPVRIIGDEQTGFLSNAALGIKYAVDNGAKVLSNSWRVYKSWSSFNPTDPNLELLHAAIKYAGDHGVIFVAASGNETLDMDTGLQTDPLFPAGFTDLPNMVVVAASTQAGGMASFSNYGVKHVTVAAPGDDIISTVPGGGFESMSGTSMATPLVAGSIARGLSAAMAGTTAVDKLINTSDQSADWATKVRAGGVINLVKYLGE